MKFGGTSVEDANAILRTARIVAGRVAQGLQPVVVVSAMAKVTDLLISAATTAARGDRADGAGDYGEAEDPALRHGDAAGDGSGAARGSDGGGAEGRWAGRDARWMEAEFDGLEEVLRGLAVVGELTPRISDMIVSLWGAACRAG